MSVHREEISSHNRPKPKKRKKLMGDKNTDHNTDHKKPKKARRKLF